MMEITDLYNSVLDCSKCEIPLILYNNIPLSFFGKCTTCSVKLARNVVFEYHLLSHY